MNWKDVELTDSFWKAKVGKFLKNMAVHQWEALDDLCEGGESHAVRNWEMAAKVIERSEINYYDYVKDSDLGKWLEAAAALSVSQELSQEDRAYFAEKIEYVTSLMEKAQSADGYLNSYYIAGDIGKRFQSISEFHEMYCAGHLAEAAVTLYEATGNDALLKTVCRYLDLLEKTFGREEEGKIPASPGHEELELALIKVWEVTHDDKYLQFAKTLIDLRGTNDYYEQEGTYRNGNKYFAADYYQVHLPVRQQYEAVGHAVRAVYLYCGATDIARIYRDEELYDTLKKLFEDVVARKMYITGGIGAHAVSERFSVAYDLPSDRAYSETCASIGLALWCYRLLRLERSEQYAAVMERCLYNTVLAGVSYDGTKYYYTNPLGFDPEKTGYRFDTEHIKLGRVGWFGCACCPPNIARTLATVGKFIYTEYDDSVSVNMLVAGKLTLADGTVQISGDWLKGETIKIKSTLEKPVFVRIPGWADRALLDGTEVKTGEYYPIDRERLHEIRLFVVPKWQFGNARASEFVGKTALVYGPFVYCAEQADNGKGLHALAVDVTAPVEGGEALFEMPTFVVSGVRYVSDGDLYTSEPPKTEKTTVRLVPYYLWNNRELGEMQVWLHAMKA